MTRSSGPGLLDTSVVIDWHDPFVLSRLPDESAISAITGAELTAGSHLAATATEAAHANRLDPYTRNPHDFAGLEGLVEIVSV